VCGETSAVDLVRYLVSVTGDSLEVILYTRLTSLLVLNEAVGKIE